MIELNKKCLNCNIDKPLSCFYKHKMMGDGYLNHCKDCKKEYAVNQYLINSQNPDWMRKERKRTRDRNIRLNYKDKHKASTPEQKARIVKINNEWRKKNPLKAKAHKMVSNAIRDGKITKQLCEVCGDSKVHAHHYDYNKPLDVVWLCPKHHGELHRKDKDM